MFPFIHYLVDFKKVSNMKLLVILSVISVIYGSVQVMCYKNKFIIVKILSFFLTFLGCRLTNHTTSKVELDTG